MTKEHRRFTEFANAVRAERTIGICHGDAGVGKTNSARRYANWDTLESYLDTWGPRSDDDAKHNTLANRARTVVDTPEVLPWHRELIRDIDRWITCLGICVDEHQRAVGKITGAHAGDSTRWVELLIVDEAERLTPTALEMLRDRHDRTRLSMILIGMPGIDQRFRHYPQLDSRLGFSHRYRVLGRDELLFVLDRHWKRLGRTLNPDDFTDAQAVAAIERITRATSDSSNDSSPRSTACSRSTNSKRSPTTSSKQLRAPSSSAPNPPPSDHRTPPSNAEPHNS